MTSGGFSLQASHGHGIGAVSLDYLLRTANDGCVIMVDILRAVHCIVAVQMERQAQRRDIVRVVSVIQSILDVYYIDML